MNDKKKHWLVRPENILRLWIVFIAILIVCVAGDFFIHQHAYFGLDGTFGFYAWYGFVTCVLMIVVAKVLGILIKRPDNYYDK
jgi:hypothetical protein